MACIVLSYTLLRYLQGTSQPEKHFRRDFLICVSATVTVAQVGSPRPPESRPWQSTQAGTLSYRW